MSDAMRFDQIPGVHPKTAAALAKLGITTAFPVQEHVIPAVADGRDVAVQSPTGSGKTLAFGIPIVEKIATGTQVPQAIIMVPTRELAVQVCSDLQAIATGKQLAVLAVYGGAAMQPQIRAAKQAAIIVATPGRLDDLIRQKAIDLRKISTIVLDEADRMLDMGFQPQVDAILERLHGQQQMMLFSATLQGAVARLVDTYTNDPVVVELDERPGMGQSINHIVWQTTAGTKVDTIVEILEQERELAVVFVRTQRSADQLCNRLRQYGVRATAIHGGMSQHQRLREYRNFQAGRCDTLIATDVFARGMDLDKITLVVNYDMPEDADTYCHRTGRTGRAGRSGTAITMHLKGQPKSLKRMLRSAGVEEDVFADLRHTQQTGRNTLPPAEHFTPAPDKSERRDRNGGRNNRSEAPRRDRNGRPQRSNNRHEQGGRSQAPRNRSEQRGAAPQRKRSNGAPLTGPGTGCIVSYDPKKGFGFITPQGGGDDLYFHRTGIGSTNPRELQRGTRVSFAAHEHQRGQRASNVSLSE